MKPEVIENFMTPDECSELIELARPRLYKSLVWDVPTGTQKEDDYRKSEQCFFARGEDPLVRRIEDAIASLSGFPVDHGEGIQVVHYNVGGYYKPHFDYFDPAFEGNKTTLIRGGQRVVTFMAYLNDVEAGGGTEFPNLGFVGIPKTGRGLMWRNTLPDGSVDPTSLHQALPVERGSKWCFTKWIRERPFV